MAGTAAHPQDDDQIPDGLTIGDRIAIDHPSWADTLETKAMSAPSSEHVGHFPAAIVAGVDGDAWMFSARGGREGEVIYVVGGDESAHVAFSEVAARHGACHEVDLDAIEIE